MYLNCRFIDCTLPSVHVLCCVYAGSFVEFDTEVDSTNKSQLFVINSEDITEHDDKPRPYLCTVCHKQFTRKYHLNRHRQIHTVESTYWYSSGECERSFPSQRHKPYKCSQCSKCFSQSSNLQSHERHIHSNKRPYHCFYCGKLFKTFGNLKRHVHIHTGAKPYSCRHCAECFARCEHLKRHLRTSHNEGT